MKKLALMFAILFITENISAQSLAINTDGSTANPTAMLDVKSTLKGFLPPRMTTTQRDAISSPAAGLIIYNTTNNGLEYYNGSTWYATEHFIGENYGGGIVFYVYDNGLHGLIASAADQSTAMRWYAGTNTNTMAYGGNTLGGIGVGSGASNTNLIIGNQGLGDGNNYAARVCHEFSVTAGLVTYEDWYLPSLGELNLLYLQKAIVGGFANNFYWSSSENTISVALYQNFSNGSQAGVSKATTAYLRAIRAF